jgi:hypothetical protein
MISRQLAHCVGQTVTRAELVNRCIIMAKLSFVRFPFLSQYSDRIRAGCPGFDFRGGQEIFISTTMSLPSLDPSLFLVDRLRSFCRRQAPHSPPSVVELKNSWRCTSTLRAERREAAATRLLGLRVRIPPAAWRSVVSVVCCELEVSASGRSIVQRSRTDCGVSECDHKAAVMRRSWPTRDCCTMGGGEPLLFPYVFLLCPN